MDTFYNIDNELIVTTVSDDDDIILKSVQKQPLHETSLLDASFSSPQLPVYQHRSRSPSSMEISSKTSLWTNVCPENNVSNERHFQKSLSFPCISKEIIAQSEKSVLFSHTQGSILQQELIDSNLALDLISNIDQLTTVGHFGLLRSMSLQSLTTLVNEFKRVSIFSAESACGRLVDCKNIRKSISFIKSSSCPHIYFPLTRTKNYDFDFASNGLDNNCNYLNLNESLSEICSEVNVANDRNAFHTYYQNTSKGLSLSETLNDSLKPKSSFRNPKLCEQKRLRENASTGCLFNSQEKCIRWLHSIGSLDNQ